MTCFIVGSDNKRIEKTDPGDEEIILFGSQILITSLFCMIIILLIGGVFSRLLESGIYLLSFCLIRIHSGGFHANTNIKCIGMFSSMFILIILSEPYFINIISVIRIIDVIFLAIFLKYAPLGTIKNPIPNCYKKSRKIKTLLFSLVMISVYFFIEDKAAYYGLCAIFVCEMPLLLGAYQIKRGKI